MSDIVSTLEVIGSAPIASAYGEAAQAATEPTGHYCLAIGAEGGEWVDYPVQSSLFVRGCVACQTIAHYAGKVVPTYRHNEAIPAARAAVAVAALYGFPLPLPKGRQDGGTVYREDDLSPLPDATVGLALAYLYGYGPSYGAPVASKGDRTAMLRVLRGTRTLSTEQVYGAAVVEETFFSPYRTETRTLSDGTEKVFSVVTADRTFHSTTPIRETLGEPDGGESTDLFALWRTATCCQITVNADGKKVHKRGCRDRKVRASVQEVRWTVPNAAEIGYCKRGAYLARLSLPRPAGPTARQRGKRAEALPTVRRIGAILRTGEGGSKPMAASLPYPLDATHYAPHYASVPRKATVRKYARYRGKRVSTYLGQTRNLRDASPAEYGGTVTVLGVIMHDGKRSTARDRVHPDEIMRASLMASDRWPTRGTSPIGETPSKGKVKVIAADGSVSFYTRGSKARETFPYRDGNGMSNAAMLLFVSSLFGGTFHANRKRTECYAYYRNGGGIACTENGGTIGQKKATATATAAASAARTATAAAKKMSRREATAMLNAITGKCDSCFLPFPPASPTACPTCD